MTACCVCLRKVTGAVGNARVIYCPNDPAANCIILCTDCGNKRFAIKAPLAYFRRTSSRL